MERSESLSFIQHRSRKRGSDIFVAYLWNGDKKPEYLLSEDTLDKAVSELRKFWREDDSPAVYVIQNDEGEPVATLMTGNIPSRCLTMYRNGKAERHEIFYHFGKVGDYLYTEITELKGDLS